MSSMTTDRESSRGLSNETKEAINALDKANTTVFATT